MKKSTVRRRVACKATPAPSVSAAVKAHDLTPKQRGFVDAYLSNGKNAGKAAIAAGYSPKAAETNGPRLLRNAQIKAAIEAGLDASAKKHEITLDRWLRELDAVAFLDPADIFEDDGSVKQIRDMPEPARRALAEITVSEIFDGDQGPQKQAVGLVKRLRLHSKLDALDKIGKHFGFYEKDNAQRPAEAIRLVVEHVQVR